MSAFFLTIPGRPRFDDDHVGDEDRLGCAVLIGSIVLVGVSAFLSWREVVYLCAGDITDASVLRVSDVNVGRHPRTIVEFEFTDPSTTARRRHSDEMSLGWRPPPGPVRVQYVPGADTYARLAGHSQRWSLWVFGASVVAAIIYLGMLAREANAPLRRSRRRPSA